MRILIFIAAVGLLIVLVVLASRFRTTILSNIKSSQSTQNNATNDVFYSATPSAVIPTLVELPTTEDTMIPTPTPYEAPTFEPVPTLALEPVSTTTYTPTTTCAGTPTAYNSEANVSTSSTLVGNSASITIQLLDCNNSTAPVSDSLTISLTSGGDASTRINGSAAPITIQTQNGTATFSVSAQNPTVDTFVVTDTTRSFAITDPKNNNPTITFSNNTSGNANCTTASGVANGWFSDVYPAGGQTVSAGSTQSYSVVIRDCNSATAPVSDTISISLNSGDPSTQVNGNNLPVTITTSNGQANFTVLSEIAQTVTLNVKDTTNNFTITDTGNNNPSVVFSGTNTATPTPTPTPGPTDTPTPTPTPTSTATQSGIMNIREFGAG